MKTQKNSTLTDRVQQIRTAQHNKLIKECLSQVARPDDTKVKHLCHDVVCASSVFAADTSWHRSRSPPPPSATRVRVTTLRQSQLRDSVFVYQTLVLHFKFFASCNNSSQSGRRPGKMRMKKNRHGMHGKRWNGKVRLSSFL